MAKFTAELDPLDSPWDDYPGPTDTKVRDAEWTKISSDFTNVSWATFLQCILIPHLQTGYREGITAGKESALQSGFDTGFADIGTPIGHELGVLRGTSSAILSFLASQPAIAQKHNVIVEARDIAVHLSNVRFSDIVPRDLDAEEHARQHLLSDTKDIVTNEELVERRNMEGLEDMLTRLTPGTSEEKVGKGQGGRPTIDDVKRLKERLETLCRGVGLDIDWS
jgi:hypothetical protein